MRTLIGVLILVGGWAPNVPAAQRTGDECASDLRSSMPAVRGHAAVALGRARNRAAVPALIAVLADPDSGVRRAAAKALGEIKDARAVTPLIGALGDDDTNVRFYAAYALGEIKAAEAAGALLRALADPEWCVRDQAAWALREIRDPKIAPALTAAIKNRSADMTQVLWLLRHLRDARTTGQLVALLEDSDEQVRLRAVAALGETPDDEALAGLVAALEDESAAVRGRAVAALAGLKDERVEGPLEKLVAREQDAAVREAARKVLFKMSCEGSLAAWWSFDDRGTRIAKDVTGRGNDGQIQGCTPVEGKVGSALRFGRAKYIELGKPAGLPIADTPLTIVAWVNSEAQNGVAVARGGAFCGFSLYVKEGTARFGIHRTQEGPTYVAAGRENVVGRWVHLAGVVKKDRIELYVNGELAATAKTKGYIPGNCGQGMEIGYDVANSAAEITDAFQGILDEVKVYHAALSAKEIARQCREKP